jgi:hypothetical protein
VVAVFDGGAIASNAGALLLGATDRASTWSGLSGIPCASGRLNVNGDPVGTPGGHVIPRLKFDTSNRELVDLTQ